MIMDWQIDECFYSAKWENIFINNSTTTQNIKKFNKGGTYCNTQWKNMKK